MTLSSSSMPSSSAAAAASAAAAFLARGARARFLLPGAAGAAGVSGAGPACRRGAGASPTERAPAIADSALCGAVATSRRPLAVAMVLPADAWARLGGKGLLWKRVVSVSSP